MANAESVNRFFMCAWKVIFGRSGHQVARAMDDIGRYENYGCGKSEIIDSGDYQVSNYQNGKITYEVAVLHETGNVTDESVILALSRACLGCKFFKNRWG